jgi:hypothetical protein
MFALAAVALLAPVAVQAQGISVTPTAGVYIPASDLYQLRDDASSLTVDKEGTFALGLNVEFGMLRGTLAYASGAQINDRGTVTGQDNIGEGKLLAVAGDIVLRPIPRLIIVQPYLLLGGGLRQENYSYEEGTAGAFPEDQSDFALHAGVGADIMLGRFGVVAEFSDFITKDDEDKWKQHDAFATVGLKIRLF